MFSNHHDRIAEFERIGEQELRFKIAHGTFFGDRSLAEEWLRVQEQRRLDLDAAKRDAREAETLRIAKRANAIAILAAVLAAASSIASAILAID